MKRLFCVFLSLYAPLIHVFNWIWLCAILNMVASTADRFPSVDSFVFFIAMIPAAKFLENAVNQFLKDCNCLFS